MHRPGGGTEKEGRRGGMKVVKGRKRREEIKEEKEKGGRKERLGGSGISCATPSQGALGTIPPNRNNPPVTQIFL